MALREAIQIFMAPEELAQNGGNQGKKKNQEIEEE